MTWTREQWMQRTDWNTVCARAAGRRKYNEERRRFAAARRDELVWPLLLKYGWDTCGVVTRVAEALGISKATASRDRRAILRSMLGL
jgi:tRNA(Glu) U13 pseudouridine synthase TruD